MVLSLIHILLSGADALVDAGAEGAALEEVAPPQAARLSIMVSAANIAANFFIKHTLLYLLQIHKARVRRPVRRCSPVCYGLSIHAYLCIVKQILCIFLHFGVLHKICLRPDAAL